MVDFAVHGGPLKALGVKVAAASVDAVDNVTSLRDDLRIGFRMYAELDPDGVAATTGAHVHDGDRTFLHATGFLIDPEGLIATAVYSTGPIGRFWASEILRKVQHEKETRKA